MIGALREVRGGRPVAARVREGLFRARTLAETLAVLTDEWDRLGITRAMDLTPLDRLGVPVFGFCVPSPLTESYCAGKGLTRDAALVSGLMEAFEYRAAHGLGIEHALRGRTVDEACARGDAIDPATLPLPVQGPFAADDRYDWVECLELVSGQPRLLPGDLFALGVGRGPGVRRASGFPSTHGKASGNVPVEAVAHALLELIERDAVALSNLEPERAVSREALAALPRASELAARIERAGVSVLVFDITSDLGVPCFEAYLSEPSGLERQHIHTGHGCHVDPEIAALRALTEACQTRLTYFAGARRDVGEGDRPLEEHDALERAHRQAAPARVAPVDTSELDLSALVEGLIARLTRHGLGTIYAVDLTPAGSRLACVSCWVPGLEGPYRRDGKLRLGARGRAVLERRGRRRPGY